MSYTTPQPTAPYGSSELPQNANAPIQAAPPQYQGVAAGEAVNEKTPYGAAPVPDQQQYTQGAPPQQQQQQAFAYATPLGSLQQGPTPVDCPSCGVRTLTRTEFKTGGTTHLAALLFCCVTCLGCIPYIAGWFKDVEHKCGHCGTLLAVWHKSGRTEVMAHGQVGAKPPQA